MKRKKYIKQHNWMYQTLWWKAARLHQLRKHPLCQVCLDRGDVVAARVVHHVTPHKGDWRLFISSSLESLCKSCHDGLEQSQERIGVNKGADIDGAPLDPDKFDKMRKGRVGGSANI